MSKRHYKHTKTGRLTRGKVQPHNLRISQRILSPHGHELRLALRDELEAVKLLAEEVGEGAGLGGDGRGLLLDCAVGGDGGLLRCGRACKEGEGEDQEGEISKGAEHCRSSLWWMSR